MPNNLKLISGRVAVTPAANVAADRYQYLDLSSAEPSLGTANVNDVLIYDSASPGGRITPKQSNIKVFILGFILFQILYYFYKQIISLILVVEHSERRKSWREENDVVARGIGERGFDGFF